MDLDAQLISLLSLYFTKRKLVLNPLSANLRNWSITLKQFFGNLTTNGLSVFDHFVGLTLEGLIKHIKYILN